MPEGNTAPEPREIPAKAQEAIKREVLKAVRSSPGPKVPVDELVEDNYEPTNYEATLKRLAAGKAAAKTDAVVKHTLGSVAVALAQSHFQRAKDIDATATWERCLARTVGIPEKALEKTLNISQPATGGLLVEGDQVDDFFRPLRAAATVLKAQPVMRSIVDGSVTVSGMETDVAVTWGDEINTAEIQSEPTYGERQRPTSHLRVIIPISNRALQSSAATQINADVEDSYRSAMAVEMDARWINGTGISSAPKGMRAFAPAATTTAGITVPNIVTDFSGAMKRMAANNVNLLRPAWFSAHRSWIHLRTLLNGSADNFLFKDEMSNDTIFGWPFFGSGNIAITEGGGTETFLLLAEMSGILVALGNTLNVAQSGDGGYTVNSVQRNAFERDETLTRVTAETTLLVAQPEMLDEVDQIVWGA